MAGEALPDATSTLKALQYIQGQAARGHFKGHSTALLVLYYLVMNMWVKPSSNGQGRGEVMDGRSGVDDIMAGTALSRSPVQRAVKWLATEEWIDTQRQLDDSGREINRYIYIKLDTAGHRERERLRVAKPAKLRLVEGSRESVPETHTRVS